MEINDTEDVIAALNKAGGSRETWEVRTYQMHRERPDGLHQIVKVTILDSGTGWTPRYAVSGVADDGKRFAGNSEDSLEVAIAAAHWFELDK